MIITDAFLSTSYGFNERMAMSQGHSINNNVCQILLENIPDVLDVLPATENEDRHGTDWWAYQKNGNALSIDCKIREIDWASTHPNKDDLALETYSVIERDVPGWTRDENKKTDYVLWLWAPTGRWCLMPFPMLCQVFREKWQEWRDTYKTKPQETPTCGGGYHSECTFVPRKLVWREIYLRYSGQL